ncbi:hypothetical protein [Reyranella sp.]|uniref:hypothetical protein n=1 Tax=Reyranella sp. TaxID=1929291 RepID=UPI003783ACBA
MCDNFFCPELTWQDVKEIDVVFWMAVFLLLVGISLGAWCVLAGGLVRTNPWRSVRHPGPGEARRACTAALVMTGLAGVAGIGAYLRGR